MKYLLDTCVISDAAKAGTYPPLEAWLAAQDHRDLGISTITLGEIRYGVERLPHGRKRTTLLAWLETELPQQFAGRIIPFTAEAADTWGTLRATAEKVKRVLPVIDGQLLAIAHAHQLTFVTRNEQDVTGLGARVLNPYLL